MTLIDLVQARMTDFGMQLSFPTQSSDDGYRREQTLQPCTDSVVERPGLGRQQNGSSPHKIGMRSYQSVQATIASKRSNDPSRALAADQHTINNVHSAVLLRRGPP
jgi:hypothetical protein